MSPLPPQQKTVITDSYGDPRDWLRLSDTDVRRGGTCDRSLATPDQSDMVKHLPRKDQRYEYRLNGGPWTNTKRLRAGWPPSVLKSASHLMTRDNVDSMEWPDLGLIERRLVPRKTGTSYDYGYCLSPTGTFLPGREFIKYFLDMLGYQVNERAVVQVQNFFSYAFCRNRPVRGHVVYRKNNKTGEITGCGL